MDSDTDHLRRLIEILDDQIAHEVASTAQQLERRLAPLYSKALSVALALSANA